MVDWSDGTDSVLLDNQEVSSARLPSVGEIVARNQQAQTAQDERLRTYVANALMEQSFRTTAADPGFDVVTENRFFVEGKSVEWEERSFRLNGTKWGANRPPFPLLQAEKVLSLPLDLRLSTDYRYRLDGVEDVDGRPCFVLRFDPIDAAQSLYRGSVWIDQETFLRVKVQTVQTKLSTPVLSSEEIAVLRHGRRRRRPEHPAAHPAGGPPDHAGRRPQPRRRARDPLRRLPAQCADFDAHAPGLARQRQRDVPRHRRRACAIS